MIGRFMPLKSFRVQGEIEIQPPFTKIPVIIWSYSDTQEKTSEYGIQLTTFSNCKLVVNAITNTLLILVIVSLFVIIVNLLWQLS